MEMEMNIIILDKYSEYMTITKFEDDKESFIINITYVPLIDPQNDIKWSRLKQDIRFMVKQNLGYVYRTYFHVQI